MGEAMSDESPPDSEYSSPFGPDPEPAGPEATGGPRRAQPGRARKGIRWGRIVIITIAVLFATVAAAVGYFGFKLNQSVSSISRDSSLLPTGSRPPSASTTATYTAMNILLIGSDSRGADQGRSDTFIVLHISADRKSVYLVSFPRDMWVTVPGYGLNKINAGYSFGGSALAVQTIENLTGARIDHVVVTDFSNFIQLVDTVGPITVDNPVASTRIAADQHGVKYNFMTKGPLQLTDGNMALAYVRERENLPNGDLDRTLRQRAFIKALALKVATPDVLANPVKLNAVMETVGKYVSVDPGMTNNVIYSLGLSMTGITSSDQIHMVMAPITGFGKSPDGTQDIDIVDKAGVTALGKALQNDTMATFVASHPSTEYGYTPSPTPAASTTATARATATATKKKT
jgi:polyisoprenyl-teichoic acid--peptidoglycan teichoic acid transferase